MNLEIIKTEYSQRSYVLQAEIYVKLDGNRVIGTLAVYIGNDDRLYVRNLARDNVLRVPDFVEVAAWLAGHEQYTIEAIRRYHEKNVIGE